MWLLGYIHSDRRCFYRLLLGGALSDILVSFFVGAIVRFGMLLSESMIPNKIFSKFFSAMIAALLAFTTVSTGLIGNIDKVIIANIMSLIPGIGLTNTLRDLFPVTALPDFCVLSKPFWLHFQSQPVIFWWHFWEGLHYTAVVIGIGLRHHCRYESDQNRR